MQNIIMAAAAFSGGFLVAGGVVALLIGLGIITRITGITHTAQENRFYESIVFLGALTGNYVTLFSTPWHPGRGALLLFGLFAGIYTGCWIMALAEMAHIFPVFSRRIGITTGIAAIIWCVALGKIIGSLLQFYENW